jgi:hypothetical protein
MTNEFISFVLYVSVGRAEHALAAAVGKNPVAQHCLLGLRTTLRKSL